MATESKGQHTGRQVTAYPNPIYVKYIIAEAYSQMESKSSVVERIIRDKYDKMNNLERDKLLRAYEKMTPEERNNPKQIRRD